MLEVDERSGHAYLAQSSQAAASHEAGDGERVKIRIASSVLHQGEVAALLERRYGARGYHAPELQLDADSERAITLCAETGQGDVIGTLTVALDTAQGLLCDEAYGDCLQPYREAGERLCEMSKFAVEAVARQGGFGRRVLAALMNVAYIYCRQLHGADRVFIEVNPRHEVFYRRWLGFRRAGELRTCVRANAPALLLALPLAHVDQQVSLVAGQAEPGHASSIYPYFAGPGRQQAIAVRLRSAIGRAIN